MSAVTVSVTRSGGIAGQSITWVVVVDEQPDSEEWLSLIERLPRARSGPKPVQPDRFVYVIRVPRRRVTLPEQQLTGVWRDFVDRVCERGEPQRAKRGTARGK
jgi:hypothetical protein